MLITRKSLNALQCFESLLQSLTRLRGCLSRLAQANMHTVLRIRFRPKKAQSLFYSAPVPRRSAARFPVALLQDMLDGTSKQPVGFCRNPKRSAFDPTTLARRCALASACPLYCHAKRKRSSSSRDYLRVPMVYKAKCVRPHNVAGHVRIVLPRQPHKNTHCLLGSTCTAIYGTVHCTALYGTVQHCTALPSAVRLFVSVSVSVSVSMSVSVSASVSHRFMF